MTEVHRYWTNLKDLVLVQAVDLAEEVAAAVEEVAAAAEVGVARLD